MREITFYNNGILDTRAFLTMGMSAKGNDNAIGRFGTGLKYAIAGILRTGGEIKIETGGETNEFSLHKEEFRGKQFERIAHNGAPTAFTTEYGKHWEPWQWFRELYSNALDEGGEVTADYDGHHDTVITVSHDGIFEAFENKDKYFLGDNEEVLFEDDFIKFFADREGQVFCRGVFVGEIDFPWGFEADSLDLTEDRTCQFEDHVLAQGIARCDVKEIIKEGVKKYSTPNFYAVYGSHKKSEVFLNIVEDKMKNFEKLSAGVVEIYTRERGSIPRPAYQPSPLEMVRFERAKKFLINAGYEIDKFPVRFEKLGQGEDSTLFGYADGQEIVMTDNGMAQNQFQMTATLLEEWMHCETGHADYTREMQDWLFEQVLKMAEFATGEPIS